MKNIIVLLTLVYSSVAFSQIAIGKDTPDPGTILDFGDDGDKGIVLPYVNSAAITTAAVPGTWYFDAVESKVKFIADVVVDMSVKGIGDPAKKFDVNSAEYLKYNEATPSVTQGTIMGANTASAPGVLVLESATLALALPVTTDYSLVLNPDHGTVVYDSTINKLCVFDGEKWAFWGR